MADCTVDVVILGGGIAGLWALDRLRAAGYAAVLLERDRLGAGQTIASQGIIHSGLKYKIPGFEDRPLASLAAMPGRWRACLAGDDSPDLSAAQVLAPRIAFHDHAGMLGRAAGGMARVLTRGDDFVVDVPSVLAALAAAHDAAIRKLPDGAVPTLADGVLRLGSLAIETRCCVLAAGAGNEALLAGFGLDEVACQRRPLQQVMAAGMAKPVFAHCVGASVKPLATVTSHRSSDGSYVWYVGGGIAEDGVAQDEAEVIARAQRDLAEFFPDVDFAGARWRTVRIDRAEFGGDGGGRPGDAVVSARGDVLVAWPTKLALAPHLADRIVAEVRTRLGEPGPAVLGALDRLDRPEIAPTPWADAAAWT